MGLVEPVGKITNRLAVYVTLEPFPTGISIKYRVFAPWKRKENGLDKSLIGAVHAKVIAWMMEFRLKQRALDSEYKNKDIN